MIQYHELNSLFIGPYKIPLYALMAAIGIILAFIILIAESKKKNLSIKQSAYVAALILIGMFFGARLMFNLGPWYEGSSGLTERAVAALLPWMKTGLVMYGGLIGGAVLAWLYMFFRRLNFWSYADIIALGGALGMMIGRYGCFFENCCKGKTAYVPWAVVHNGIPHHPFPTYESVFFLLLFIYLLKIRERQRFEGQLFLIFMVSYPIARFFLEMTRQYNWNFYWLTASQIISIVILAIFLPIYAVKHRKSTLPNKTEKQSSWTYVMLLAGGLMMTFAVYMTSAWNMWYSFSLFNIGMVVMLAGLAKVFNISIRNVIKQRNILVKAVAIFIVATIILISFSAIIQKIAGSIMDSDERKNCPYEKIGDENAGVKILYFSSPYCYMCWQEELFVLPKLNIKNVYLEKYDIRHCKEQSDYYTIDNAPAFAFIKGEKETIYYDYMSSGEMMEGIEQISR